MKKMTSCLMLAFGVTITSKSQIPATYSLPSVKTEWVITSKLASLSPTSRFVVTNTGDSAITALRFVYGCGALKQHQIFDTLEAYGLDRPIKAKTQWTSFFASQDIKDCPGGVDGAIFEDGHTEGDKKAIQELYSDRQGIDPRYISSNPPPESGGGQ